MACERRLGLKCEYFFTHVTMIWDNEPTESNNREISQKYFTHRTRMRFRATAHRRAILPSQSDWVMTHLEDSPTAVRLTDMKSPDREPQPDEFRGKSILHSKHPSDLVQSGWACTSLRATWRLIDYAHRRSIARVGTCQSGIMNLLLTWVNSTEYLTSQV